jgi:hypothetical protein
MYDELQRSEKQTTTLPQNKLNYTMSVVCVLYTSNHYDTDTNQNTVPLFVHHDLWLNPHKLTRVALNQNIVTF